MKKTLTKLLVLTLLIALTAISFVGCSDQYDANYEEADSEAVYDAVSTLETDKLFGDTTQSGWQKGLQVVGSMKMETLVEGVVDGEEGYMNSVIELDIDQKIVLSKGADGIVIKGSGEMSFDNYSDMQASYEGETETMESNSETDIVTYLDGEYIYMNSTISSEWNTNGEEGSESETNKTKIAIAPIMSILSGMLDGFDTTGKNEIEAKIDIATAIAQYDAMGFTFKMDASEGIKIKLEANENFIATLESSYEGYGDSEVDVDDIALYVIISEEGEFVSAKLAMDYSISAGAEGIEAGADMELEIEISAYSGSVDTLTGLDEYEEVSFDLGDLLF